MKAKACDVGGRCFSIKRLGRSCVFLFCVFGLLLAVPSPVQVGKELSAFRWMIFEGFLSFGTGYELIFTIASL
jgi:hypothetical protein